MRSIELAAAVTALALACAGGKHEQREGAGRGAEPSGERSRARPKASHRPEAPGEGVPRRGERPPVPTSPEGLLAPGAVGRIQRALEARGYLAEAHRRGELDRTTTRAIEKFQEDEGLASTGMPDRETLDRLGVDPNAAYRQDEGRGSGDR